jgi:DNA-binding NarL/FixJ family response regulator
MQPEEDWLRRPNRSEKGTGDSLIVPPRDLSNAPEPPPTGFDASAASIAVLDPKPLTRRLIADMLARAFPEYGVTAAGHFEELLNSLEKQAGRPSLVVIYLRSASLSDPFVKTALECLRSQLPDAPVILLSDRNDLCELASALTQGLRGYIPTSLVFDVAMAAFKLIDAGGTYIPPDVLRSDAAESHFVEPKDRGGDLQLTARELSVLDLLREGKPNKVIATELEMQESTVKVHVRNILKKLQASNRTQAVRVASKLLQLRE